jgi:hypothetical protein
MALGTGTGSKAPPRRAMGMVHWDSAGTTEGMAPGTALGIALGTTGGMVALGNGTGIALEPPRRWAWHCRDSAGNH